MKKLKKILLIDDDKVNNYLNQIILEELHIAEEIVVLTNGNLGLNYLLESCKSFDSCPELVIFDHRMPIMDGMEMMLNLKQVGFLDRAKVVFILLGIHSKSEDITKFSELGVQEYTDKPLSKEAVMEAYHKYFVGNTVNRHTS